MMEPGRSFRRVLAGGPIAGLSALGTPEEGMHDSGPTGTTIAPSTPRLVATWYGVEQSKLPQC